MGKKVGGVRVTFRPVQSRQLGGELVASGLCVCGKMKAECNAEWDKKLGVRGHTADSQSGISEYERNRMNIRDAMVSGGDPYCMRATATADGFVSGWTPHMPSGSFSVPTQQEANHGKRGKGSGHQSERRPGRGSGNKSGRKRR